MRGLWSALAPLLLLSLAALGVLWIAQWFANFFKRKKETSAEDSQEKKAMRKRNLLYWLLWWRIDQDELNKQVAEYESMSMTRSAKGQSFLLLNLSALVTTAWVVFAHLSVVYLSDVLIALVLGYFIYSGHRWATIAAMAYWSIAKLIAIWDISVGFSPLDNPGGRILQQLVWWCICMHAFYLAFRVEGLRRERKQRTTD